MKKRRSSVVDWLKLEDRIREALKAYRNNENNAEGALKIIDDVVGEETGRGWELV